MAGVVESFDSQILGRVRFEYSPESLFWNLKTCNCEAIINTNHEIFIDSIECRWESLDFRKLESFSNQSWNALTENTRNDSTGLPRVYQVVDISTR